MNLSNVLAVSGLPGLYELAANRPNGLLLIPIEGGKSKFCSSRKHQFTPLETVAIYTWSDTVELKNVFNSMTVKIQEVPLPDLNGGRDVLNSYFEQILPEFDRERVYPNDIKKVIKWYVALEAQGFLSSTDEEE
ncbi:MAG TPA: hypothetical protein DCM04_05495 [Saprospirales bacterium]|jgi:hypothetical protein|nr:hypothetical protein [Saprospirales bacterium]|tara:strand:- start:2189 stop:2590 length:402 start_codon:yes stop_codon:yes gene_type:complete